MDLLKNISLLILVLLGKDFSGGSIYAQVDPPQVDPSQTDPSQAAPESLEIVLVPNTFESATSRPLSEWQFQASEATSETTNAEFQDEPDQTESAESLDQEASINQAENDAETSEKSTEVNATETADDNGEEQPEN
ncbi:MAG: hypothetical protein F6K19_49975 [Cyanothece sp. SIO1E1]|nr:hypothetical protein [Cyanothece sp. SIO1E1]